MKEILTRSITGAVFVAVILGSLWLGNWVSFLVMGLVGILGLHEFYTLKKNPLSGPTRWLSILVGASSFFVYTGIALGMIDVFFIPHAALIPVLLIFIAEIYRNKEHPLENTSLSSIGWIYIMMPLFLLAFLASEDVLYAFSPLIITWTNDTFAYLGGRLLGKKSLFPRISPKKTWEGTLVGISFAILAGLIISLTSETSLIFWIITAFLVSLASILGDLFESLFKRSLQIKDSGNLLPGHGGILDRLDATFFAVPLFYLLLTTALHFNWFDF